MEEEPKTRVVWQFAQDHTARARTGMSILYLVFLSSKVHNTLSEVLKCKQNNLSVVVFSPPLIHLMAKCYLPRGTVATKPVLG